jgi:hypothetical protein
MDNMAPWVFAMNYGGFGLLAIAIAVLLVLYARARWKRVLAVAPRRPAGWSIAVGAVGMLPFGAAMLWWGAVGAGALGPQGMEAPAQRTTLVVTGLLALAGWAAPLVGASARWSQAVWLVTWVGCTTAALQGPAQLLLANGGEPTPAIVLIAVLATPASCVYGLVVLRRGIRETGVTSSEVPASRAGGGASGLRSATRPTPPAGA